MSSTSASSQTKKARTPYDDRRITLRTVMQQIETFHGFHLNASLSPEGGREGVLLFGPPGIGKSQTVMSTAQRLAADAGFSSMKSFKAGATPEPSKDSNECLFVHLSFAGLTSGGVSGFPVVSKESTDYMARYVVPEAYRMAAKYPGAIYLFDEMNQVVSQEALLSFLSEGFYHDTTMSKRSLFIGTSNEGSIVDQTRSVKLSSAFKNRMGLYYMRADVAEWRQDFAVPAQVNPAVIAFATLYAEAFENFTPAEHENLNMPTMRSLEHMSNSLKSFEHILAKRGGITTGNHDSVVSGLQHMTFSRLGSDFLAGQFANFYMEIYKDILPAVSAAIRGQLPSPEFLKNLQRATQETRGLEDRLCSADSPSRVGLISRLMNFSEYLSAMGATAIVTGMALNKEKLKLHTPEAQQTYMAKVLSNICEFGLEAIHDQTFVMMTLQSLFAHVNAKFQSQNASATTLSADHALWLETFSKLMQSALRSDQPQRRRLGEAMKMTLDSDSALMRIRENGEDSPSMSMAI